MCVTHTTGTDAALCCHRRRLLNNLDGPFWHDVYEIFKFFGMWTHQKKRIFPLCVSPSQMSSAPEEPAVSLNVIHAIYAYTSHVAF